MNLKIPASEPFVPRIELTLKTPWRLLGPVAGFGFFRITPDAHDIIASSRPARFRRTAPDCLADTDEPSESLKCPR
jgi:hypothetical protein